MYPLEQYSDETLQTIAVSAKVLVLLNEYQNHYSS